MIDNEYVFETTFEFDLPYLEKLVSNSIKANSIKKHQRLVSQDPYLKSIKEKLPFLSPIWNFYDIFPSMHLPPHIDAARTCALNIPLRGTVGSSTIFYKPSSELKLRYDEGRVLDWVDSDLEEAFKFELTVPSLIRNNLPHAVVNGPNKRLILSWSVSTDYTFAQAKEIIKNNS
jgi:hypothetical protein